MTALAAGRRVGFAPANRVRVDHTHPLASGLGMAGVFNAVVYPGPNVSSNSERRYSAAGAVWATSSPAMVQGVAFPAQSNTTSFTMAAAISTRAVSTDYLGFLGAAGYTGGGPGDSRIALEGSSTGARLAYWRFSNYYPVSVSTTEPGLLVGVKSGLTLTCYHVSVGGICTTSTRTFTSGQLTVNASTCQYGSDHKTNPTGILAGWFWPSRALTFNEVCALAQDPFGMFRTP